jgi:hypothetical protein
MLANVKFETTSLQPRNLALQTIEAKHSSSLWTHHYFPISTPGKCQGKIQTETKHSWFHQERDKKVTWYDRQDPNDVSPIFLHGYSTKY